MKILFLDIDTLRPDHMSCYGYGRKTTPHMDAVAKEGVQFSNYYCSDAPCLPSRASLITGLFGIKNGVVGHGGTAADRVLSAGKRSFFDPVDENNLTNIFRRAGMYTASISSFPERHSAWWFNAGFQEMYNEGHKGLESGEAVLPYALDWLDKNGTARNDWFLHVHFWDPHTPYRAPEAFGNPFEKDGFVETGWINEEVLIKHKEHVGPHSANELNMFDDRESDRFPRNPGRIDDLHDVRRVIDGYDCGVAYTDYLVGKIFDRLKLLGIYDDVAIIITGDHGENLGELGLYAEHATADHPCCHIPFIIRWPGCIKNHEDEELHYSLDLLPTVSELLGLPIVEEWDGESFANTLLKGEKQGRESLVISQMAHVCQRSARFDKWLYIRTYHDGFHLFDREMLFDLEADPYEQKDVKKEHPEICAQGAKIILEWHDKAMMEGDQLIDPLWTVMSEGGPFHTVGFLDKYCKRLEETGRVQGAKELRKRHGKKKQTVGFDADVL